MEAGAGGEEEAGRMPHLCPDTASDTLERGWGARKWDWGIRVCLMEEGACLVEEGACLMEEGACLMVARKIGPTVVGGSTEV